MPDDLRIKIHILRCGSVSLPSRAAAGDGKRPVSFAEEVFTGERGRVTLPVCAYLIEHPKGLVLVDTGFPRAISPDGNYDAKAVRALLPAHLAAFYRPVVPPGQSIGEQLAALGIRPDALDAVLLTHFDPDHIGALCELRGAKRILGSEEERWWAVRTLYRLRQPQRLWADYPIEVFWFKGTELGPRRWSYDLFGDGSVQLVSVPGHCDGLFAPLITSGGRFALLTSDAAFSRRSWEELRIPGFGFNPVAQRKSLEWIREMSLRPGCAAVVASHDPDETPRVIEL